jgi:hypothetical protein
MANPVGNFKDGQLEKLHLSPIERCNIDDSKDSRELTWVEAFRLVAGEVDPRLVYVPPIRDLLCQNCFP